MKPPTGCHHPADQELHVGDDAITTIDIFALRYIYEHSICNFASNIETLWRHSCFGKLRRRVRGATDPVLLGLLAPLHQY